MGVGAGLVPARIATRRVHRNPNPMRAARSDAIRAVFHRMHRTVFDERDAHGVGGHQTRPYNNDPMARIPGTPFHPVERIPTPRPRT